MSKDKLKIIIRNIRQELSLIRHYYKVGKIKDTMQSAIFMVDGRHYHGGLTDRLKGIISIYAYSKCVAIPFRIYFRYPFILENYLEPNKYDWRISDKELSYSILESNPIILFSEINGNRLFHLKRCRQHHFYLNRDLLPAINKFYKKNFNFGNLFHELFKPTPLLESAIIGQLNDINGEYIAIVFRFQQLLNDFKEGNFEVLNNDDRNNLINKCLESIDYIANNYPNTKCLITSDSRTFIDLAKKKINIVTLPGELSHMEFPQGNEDIMTNMKSFLDLIMISKSKKVYSVIIDGFNMYPSEFPKYAALLGEVPFERIYIK